MKNDDQLIHEFQNGHRQAFDELVRRYLDSVYSFFFRLTGDEMESEDMAQDVFLQLYKYLPKFRFESSFTTYLYRINTNVAITVFRKKHWRKLLHLDQVPEPATQTDDGVFKKQELWSAIRRLPKQQQRIVMLRTSQQLPYKDIAAILNISESSAKVNYHHGVQKLKSILQV
ncbi:MAG: sigma-70 family RNA polymerase sigma factor [FCB group bacterium]|nr:sigma-70 family RNA polymerase sigma factor [FCB group bacterium]